MTEPTVHNHLTRTIFSSHSIASLRCTRGRKIIRNTRYCVLNLYFKTYAKFQVDSVDVDVCSCFYSLGREQTELRAHVVMSHKTWVRLYFSVLTVDWKLVFRTPQLWFVAGARPDASVSNVMAAAGGSSRSALCTACLCITLSMAVLCFVWVQLEVLLRGRPRCGGSSQQVRLEHHTALQQPKDIRLIWKK